MMTIEDQRFQTSAVASALLKSLLVDVLLADKPWSPESIDKDILESFNAFSERPLRKDKAEVTN